MSQFILDGFSIERDPDFPGKLIHFSVIDAIRVPDGFAMPPKQHIVVLYNDSKPEDRAYSTHHVAYQDGWTGLDGPWVVNEGHYDRGRLSAYKDMILRAAKYFG